MEANVLPVNGSTETKNTQDTAKEDIRKVPTTLYADQRTEVLINNRPDKAIVADYIDAITADNARAATPWVLSRGYTPVYVRRDAQSNAYFDTLDTDAAVYIMERVSDTTLTKTERIEGKRQPKRYPAPVPRRIASLLLKDVELRFPAVNGISRVPGLRKDGTIYATPGYDAAAQIYYDPPKDFTLPPICDEPTQEDARKAVEVLNDVLVDFPFSTASDRANAFALALTLVTRHAITGNVPLSCINAKSGKGTGKTFLAEILHRIATGEPPAMNSLPNDNAEIRKVITTKAVRGSTFVMFDNVTGVVQFDALENALTTPKWEDRLLGGNVDISTPLRCTWVMTGNNLRLGEDLQRRSYFIHLDAKMARAYLRGGATNPYKHPFLEQYVTEHRGELLAALLTIARAWFAAGSPQADLTPFAGSYPEWSRMMAGMLAWAGVEGFLGTLSTDLDDQGEDEMQWESFLLAVHEMFGDTSQPSKALAQACEPDMPIGSSLGDVLPDVLVKEQDKSRSPRAFEMMIAKYLRNRAGRRFGSSGVYIAKIGEDSRSKRPLWQVVVPQAEDTIPPPTLTIVKPVMEHFAAPVQQPAHMAPVSALEPQETVLDAIPDEVPVTPVAPPKTALKRPPRGILCPACADHPMLTEFGVTLSPPGLPTCPKCNHVFEEQFDERGRFMGWR